MITVIDNALNGVKFKDLGVGATFKCGDAYFIVVGFEQETKFDDSLDNAVNLSDGHFETFHDDDLVIPFNCELIIL